MFMKECESTVCVIWGLQIYVSKVGELANTESMYNKDQLTNLNNKNNHQEKYQALLFRGLKTTMGRCLGGSLEKSHGVFHSWLEVK
jgi:hypothetical protein